VTHLRFRGEERNQKGIGVFGLGGDKNQWIFTKQCRLSKSQTPFFFFLNEVILLIEKDDYYSLETKKSLIQTEEINKDILSVQTLQRPSEEALLARQWATSLTSLRQ
jgi:hypothetical protein